MGQRRAGGRQKLLEGVDMGRQIDSFNVGEKGEYISDYLRGVTFTKVEITEDMAIKLVGHKLYNKQFVSVGKTYREWGLTKLLFVYHHDFVDYLYEVVTEN